MKRRPNSVLVLPALLAALSSIVAPTDAMAKSGRSSAAAPTLGLGVYFARGERLVRVEVRVPRTRAVAAAAMRSLLAGPKDKRLSTAIPRGTRLLGISVRNGIATVDLNRTFERGGGALSMSMRLAQVVYTMTQFRTIRAVNLALEGRRVTVFSGEGLVLDHPLDRADYRELAPR
jgi:germination protein M